MYVGNGQYYDPTTGRFLTRDVNPNSPNPYVPWNPIGAILGPLGVLSLVAMRRRGKRNKNEPYLFLFIMLVVLPLSVGMACGTPTQPSNPPVETPTVLSATDIPPLPTQTQTPSPTAPPPPTDTPAIDSDCCGIPPAIYDYPCTPYGTNTCIDRNIDTPVVQIAHTVQGEGGAFSDKVAANVLQTIINRAYTYWVITHHQGINPDNIPWSRINKEKLTRLFLFILSEPGGEGEPSYNAWSRSVPRSGIQWEHIVAAVNDVLNKAGTHPSTAVMVNGELPAAEVRSDTNVQWYGATNDPTWFPPKDKYVYFDTIESYRVDEKGNGYYVFCGRQFYGKNGVIRPPRAVIECPEK